MTPLARFDIKKTKNISKMVKTHLKKRFFGLGVMCTKKALHKKTRISFFLIFIIYTSKNRGVKYTWLKFEIFLKIENFLFLHDGFREIFKKLSIY